MARALRHIVLGLATTGLLAGCVGSGGAGNTSDEAPTTAASAPSRGGTGKDVEAPEIFQTTDSALWDGRPSLGGIWVASPDAVDPERVVMFNPATGKTVTGALFRRERDNPGPTLQISSDAAEALGILAGQPTEIRVTALRRAEPEAPPVEAAPAEATAETAPDGEAAAPEGAAAAPTEAEALAAAALDATGATAAAAAGAVDAAAPAVEEPPKRKTWKERRAEAKAKREAEKAARAAEKAAAEAAAAGAAPADGATVSDAPTADSVDVGVIETAPLDARDAEVAAAAAGATATPPEEPRKTRRQKQAEAEAAAAAAAAAPAPAPTATAGRPIQIASFSKEENAKRAVEALAKIGITASPQKSDRGGKAVWGVVAFGDQALLAKIKDAGFADAYFLQ